MTNEITLQNNSKLHLDTLKGSNKGWSAKDLHSESISGASPLSVLVVVSGSFINTAFTALIYSVDFATGETAVNWLFVLLEKSTINHACISLKTKQNAEMQTDQTKRQHVDTLGMSPGWPYSQDCHESSDVVLRVGGSHVILLCSRLGPYFKVKPQIHNPWRANVSTL